MEFLFLRSANFSQTVMCPFMLAVLDHTVLDQGSPNYIPRAKSGPRRHFIRPANRFC